MHKIDWYGPRSLSAGCFHLSQEISWLGGGRGWGLVGPITSWATSSRCCWRFISSWSSVRRSLLGLATLRSERDKAPSMIGFLSRHDARKKEHLRTVAIKHRETARDTRFFSTTFWQSQNCSNSVQYCESPAQRIHGNISTLWRKVEITDGIVCRFGVYNF